MNDNTPQAAAERDGAILDAQISKECERITDAVMEGQEIAMPMPPLPYGIFQWFTMDTGWCSLIVESDRMMKVYVQGAKTLRQPYRVTLLHPESGNAREDRLRDERREKDATDND